MSESEFAYIYVKYYETVIHIAFDILQDYHLSEYICQEVFVEFHKEMKGIDKERVKGWLLRRGKKRAGKLARKRWKKKEIVTAARKAEVGVGAEYFF